MISARGGLEGRCCCVTAGRQHGAPRPPGEQALGLLPGRLCESAAMRQQIVVPRDRRKAVEEPYPTRVAKEHGQWGRSSTAEHAGTSHVWLSATRPARRAFSPVRTFATATKREVAHWRIPATWKSALSVKRHTPQRAGGIGRGSWHPCIAPAATLWEFSVTGGRSDASMGTVHRDRGD